MSTELGTNLRRRETWMRGLYMVLFAVLFNIAEIVLAVVAIFQFLAQLTTGGVNRRLQTFGSNLATYLQETTAFLTYAGETQPFPIGPWPGSADRTGAGSGPLGPGTEAATTDDETDSKAKSR